MQGGFLASGTLYIDRLTDAGESTGFIQVDNCTAFEIKEESELKERTSKMKETYGQKLDVVALKTNSNVKVAFNGVSTDVLAMILLGEAVDHNVGAGTVTDESVTAKSGKWISLAQKNLTDATVVVTDDPEVTTYVDGTDYSVNYALGLLEIKSGGGISDGADLLVDYDHAAISASRISGATQPIIRAKLALDGKNIKDGKGVRVEVDEAVLTPDSPVDFMSSDWVEVSLSGTMKTLTGKTTPYTVTPEK
ncbi:MAG: hypothetical protein HQL52_03910 [Magnetococcales bacterium]|nr:hypothetical protein [Magnetococcales bacterium]